MFQKTERILGNAYLANVGCGRQCLQSQHWGGKSACEPTSQSSLTDEFLVNDGPGFQNIILQVALGHTHTSANKKHQDKIRDEHFVRSYVTMAVGHLSQRSKGAS